jgi:hypothetical protein
MEMIAEYLDYLSKDTIERQGFIRAEIQLQGRTLEFFVKDNQDNKNTEILTLAAGFTNLEHYQIFYERCLRQREHFEIFYRHGGFMYFYPMCRLQTLTPLVLKMKSPVPFSLKNFEFYKMTIEYRRNR